jgi:hypothetical protein
VPPEKSISRTLPHLSGKILEVTLPLVPRGTEARASNPMKGPRASHLGSVTTIKAEEPRVILSIKKAQGQSPYQYWSQHLSYFFLSQTQVFQENYCLGHIRPASTVLFHSVFSLLLERVPFQSLLFNCPRKPYSSTMVRPSISFYFCLPLITEQVDPMVSMDEHTMGQALTVVPVLIHLKDTS